MQARFSTPSSLAAHHRRLMASCAESGCPQVRQRSGAKLSARTVGESLCMSKSVEAHYKGQIVSARDLPTGCQQQCSLAVPTVRASRHLTEPSAKSPQKQPTKRPEREPLSGNRPWSSHRHTDHPRPRPTATPSRWPTRPTRIPAPASNRISGLSTSTRRPSPSRTDSPPDSLDLTQDSACAGPAASGCQLQVRRAVVLSRRDGSRSFRGGIMLAMQRDDPPGKWVGEVMASCRW
jgi:hypothetical protein